MLTAESLLAEAGNRGLPPDKKRAIVREYAHILILKAIYQGQFGRELFFTGGTALRLVYQLPRFSEDLDFDASSFSNDSMKALLPGIHAVLTKEGFSCEYGFKEAESLFRARVKLTNALQYYGLSPLKQERLEIKIEIYCPRWKLKGRSEIIQGFGEAFPILLLEESELLAEKVLALLNRKRGRDIYDLFFMLRRKFPFDPEVLRSRELPESLPDQLGEFFRKLDPAELKNLRRQLEPFLFRAEEGEWIGQAPDYFKAFLGAKAEA